MSELNSDETCPLCPNPTSPSSSTPTVLPQLLNWIQCANCSKWYHNHCLSLPQSEAKQIMEFHCPECTPLVGPSVMKRHSSRKRRKVDYVALDGGYVDSVILDKHPHVDEFLNWRGTEMPDSVKGADLAEFAKRTKVAKPILVKGEDREGLGLSIPLGFGVDAVVESLGAEHDIEIMDVLTQNGIKGSWTLGGWRDYFMSEKKERERILNVLSLEISDSEIGRSIGRPLYVEDVDLVDAVWPEELKDEKPMVKKYCLMGVENSYTDFHLDFAGTSVYYTVISGEKIFMFFPPTEHNLKKYVNWIKNPLESSKFLGNCGLEHGMKVELHKDDALIIPSGWIHAVYTPVDTVVVGGNFLTAFNIPTQFKIIDIEIKTKVDKKFKFPNFSKLMWFTAKSVLDGKVELSKESMIELEDYLQKQCGMLKDNKMKRLVKDGIPYSFIGKPLEFLQKYQNFVSAKSPQLPLNIKEENNEVMNGKVKYE